MLSQYLKDRNISLYSLAKTSGIPYTTVSELANGKVSGSNCRGQVLHAIASALEISMDELYSMCAEHMSVICGHGTVVDIEVRSKQYYICFDCGSERVEIALCKVSPDSSFYINEFAVWAADRYLSEKAVEDFQWNTI